MKRTQKLVAGGILLALFANLSFADAPRGAKAIFDSGEGSSIAMPSAPGASRSKPAPAARDEQRQYVGISYQVLQMMDNGEVRQVAKSRVFRNGDRVKLVVRTNRPGYLSVMNVGPTGSTHVLFNEYVEGFRPIEVPRNSNLRFVGAPGTERLFFMLSNDPNPLAAQYQPVSAQQQTVSAPPPPTAYAPPPLPPASDTAPPPLPVLSPPPFAGDRSSPPPMVASIDGAKNMKGAKDLVAEDGMQSSYSVLSPGNGYQPKQAGMKDLVLESQDGVNYGVVPVSAISGGGILTLAVSLRHH